MTEMHYPFTGGPADPDPSDHPTLQELWDRLSPQTKQQIRQFEEDLKTLPPLLTPKIEPADIDRANFHRDFANKLRELHVKPASGLASPPAPTYTPPVDLTLLDVVNHPSVIVVLGHRGSGKTALALRIQELLRHQAPPYAVGLPDKARRFLPDWYGLADDFTNIPNNATIYLPESYRYFHSRDSQSSQGRALADLVNLSRHRRHTLIFDVQNAAHLDRNILSEADVVLVKEPGPFQEGFERAQYKKVMDNARAAFASVRQWRRKRAVWLMAPAADIYGQLMENQLPSFWKDSLSRLFGDTRVKLDNEVAERVDRKGGKGGAPRLRRGKKTSTPEKQAIASQMRQSGYSYGEIAQALGTSRSYAYKLVNGPQ